MVFSKRRWKRHTSPCWVKVQFSIRNSWGFLHAVFRVFKVQNDTKAHQTVLRAVVAIVLELKFVNKFQLEISRIVLDLSGRCST